MALKKTSIQLDEAQINTLCARTGDSPSDVVRDALNLYQMMSSTVPCPKCGSYITVDVEPAKARRVVVRLT